MKNLVAFVLVLLLSSCTTQLKYLGDTHEPNPNPVDVYYDVGDIKSDYKVIGKLSGQSQGLRSLDDVKNDMIKDAQKRGADGILFSHFDSFEENHNVFADLIVYQ